MRRSTLALTTAALSVITSRADARPAPPNYGHDFVTVGAPGNRAARASERLYGAAFAGFPNLGAVNYQFRISRTEMTATQWLPFVNAFTTHWDAMGRNRNDVYFRSEIIDATNLNPNSPPGWHILPGAESRAITAGWRMMAYYCNWLHNGRPEGSWSNPVPWEVFANGAYDASTFTQNPDLSFNDQITHNPGALYWIPTLDEWTKAAHYDPDRYGPGRAGYWLMMARRNTPLFSGLASIGGQTSAGSNFAVGFDPRTIPVGSYPGITSPWGLLDTSGGVAEWTEAPSYEVPGGVPGFLRSRLTRGSRAFDGGAYLEFDLIDHPFGRGSVGVGREGFRIASAVSVGVADGNPITQAFPGPAVGRSHVAPTGANGWQSPGPHRAPALLDRPTASVQVLAASGKSAPGADPDATFLGFGRPSINELGQVVFAADVVGPGVSEGSFTGVWAQRGARIAALARSDRPAPGAAPGTVFSIGIAGESSLETSIDRAGRCLFATTTASDVGVDFDGFGLWHGEPGLLTGLAISGQQAPGLAPGVTFEPPSTNYYPSVRGVADDGGRVMFTGRIIDPGLPSSIIDASWIWSSGQYVPIVVTGDPSATPGILGPYFFGGGLTPAHAPIILAVDTTPSPGSSLSICRVLGERHIEVLIRPGCPAPGAPIGVTTRDIDLSRAFATGRFAWSATLAGGGLSPSTDQWAYRGEPGAWSIVARSRDVAPGFPPGTVLSKPRVSFNARERAIITSAVTGPAISPVNRVDGLWVETAGGWTLLGKTGGPAPGANATFGPPPGSSSPAFASMAINLHGQCAFTAYVAGAGITTANSFALWITDATGTPSRILGEGDTVWVDGAARIVQTLDLTLDASDNALPRTFNNRGQVVARLLFRDGTQAIALLEGGSLCSADANGDGTIDFLDLNLVLSYFGETSTTVALPGDVDDDGDVDFTDLCDALGAFGTGC